MWYALCRENERVRDLNLANMLLIANRGDEKDVKGLFEYLKG